MRWRAFLCDDADGYRELVRAVLEPEGFEVVGEAADGQSCLDAVVAAAPDLILLDVSMPRLDGCQALPGLRERTPGAKIVMLSTAPAADQAEECLRLGADAYVQKPVDLFELPALVRAAVA